MENDNQTDKPKRKWKKKKSLLSNAKKYGKKECWGRGTKISEDMYHYFVGILEVMKNGFDDDEEKATFVTNVLERTHNEEVNLCGNQLGCRIVEQLLPFSTPEALERYIDALSDELRVLCSDNFSSFVIEQLMIVCCDRYLQSLNLETDSGEGEESEEPPQKKSKKEKTKVEKDKNFKYPKNHIEKCCVFTFKLAKYCLNNLEDFVWDSSANRILRTSIKCLGGIVSAPCEKPKENLFGRKQDDDKPSQQINKKQHTLPLVYREVPKEFTELVQEYAERLSQWPQFADMPYETLTSGLLQILIYSLKNTNKKLTRQIVKKLLEESFAPDSWMSQNAEEDKKDIKLDLDEKEDDNVEETSKPLNLPPVFESEPAVRLLEACLQVAKSKIYTQIYAKCFINRLGVLGTMSGLNFTVQRLIDNCEIKEEFEPMFDELADKFDKILVSGNTGVLVALAKACLRLQCKQVKFIQALDQALGCSDTENSKYFVYLCARLLPLHRVKIEDMTKSYFVNVHGSVILQTVLSFQRPKRVIDSLLEMTTDELLILFSDAKGSHVGDAVFTGQYVGAKSREQMIKKLRGTFQQLAICKYGSRVLESIMKSSNLEQKIKIMDELSDKSKILNSSMFGQVVGQKLKVELYKKSFQNWKSAMEKDEKTKSLFNDVIMKKII